MTLTQSTINLIRSLLPTVERRTIVRDRAQPPSQSQLMDVDRLHDLLRRAEGGDTTDLFGLYRDIIAGHAHTQSEFSKRKLAVLGDPFILIQSSKDPAAIALTQQVQNDLAEREDWFQFLNHCLDSTLYPVAVTDRRWQPSSRPGWRYEVASLSPVRHYLLTWPDGEFSIREVSSDGSITGTVSPVDPRIHIAHRGHLLSSVPDWWGGPMRSVLFWWLFATQDREWWSRFLERFGSPFLLGKYDENDPDARYLLQDAFSTATRIFGLAVTRNTDVELQQANTASGDAFEKFHAVANREISKAIVGQTSSADIQNSGLNGGGQGAVQSEVRDDIRKFDAATLANTIRTRIIIPLWRLNGWTHPIPTVAFGGADETAAEMAGNFFSDLYAAGIELSDSGLETVAQKYGVGLRRIKTIDPTSQPAALSSTPTLIPSVALRAAKAQQARRAVDELTRQSSPAVAEIFSQRATDFEQAIVSANSPEQAIANVSSLCASFDPTTSADLLTQVLTSASYNGLSH